MNAAPARHTRVVHHTPHRTRLKLSAKRRNPREMRRITQALCKNPAVHDVETHPTTGSIIVHHDKHALTNITDVLQDIGVVAVTAAGIELPHDAQGPSGGDALVHAVNDLNRRLRLSSGGLLDLRILVPAGFAALAVRQALRYGLQVESAPWYVLAYLAFDSFVKLRPAAPSQPGR